MEDLKDSRPEDEAQTVSPAWHGPELRFTADRHRVGQEQAVPWTEARRQLLSLSISDNLRS